MKKSLLILLLSLILFPAFAQDGVFKFKQIKLSFKESKAYSYQLYQTTYKKHRPSSRMGLKSSGKFDARANEFNLSYAYTGIGGGSDNRLYCPPIWVELKYKKKGEEVTQMIPIVLEICSMSQARKIEVLNIDLKPFKKQQNQMIVLDKENDYKVVDKESVEIGNLTLVEE